MAEAKRLRALVPVRERRSQAERTAETRTRIVAAVFESIAEVGLARTTAVEVTRRAGVTWGAVQHHFGGKDGMLIAAVEDSLRLFASRLDSVPVEGRSLADRARAFVESAWKHFSSREYRSAFEILLDTMGRDDLPGSPTWQGEMFRDWHRVWMRIFHDSPLPRSRHRVLEHYTISVLAGLASALMLEGGGVELPSHELDLLVDTLVRELGRSAS